MKILSMVKILQFHQLRIILGFIDYESYFLAIGTYRWRTFMLCEKLRLETSCKENKNKNPGYKSDVCN